MCSVNCISILLIIFMLALLEPIALIVPLLFSYRIPNLAEIVVSQRMLTHSSGDRKPHHHDFRGIVDSEREEAVAQPLADKHSGGSVYISAGCIFGEKSLVRGYNAGDEWQPNLPAMGMPGKNQIHLVFTV